MKGRTEAPPVPRFEVGDRVRVVEGLAVGEVVSVHRFPRATAYAVQLEEVMEFGLGTYVERELVPA